MILVSRDIPRKSSSLGPSVHEPVLVKEVVQSFAPRSGGYFVDATVGGGGHAAALLSASSGARIFAVDRDAQALDRARIRLDEFSDRVEFVHAPFSSLAAVVPAEMHGRIDGILADFGLSSDQIEDRERGFSFLLDGPLDMRMDKSTQKTGAAILLARASEDEIETWLREYGEERYARRIAHALVEARRRGPILRTSQLADIISRSVPRTRQSIHPATRTFQALRIAVNHELDEIDAFLQTAPALLAPGGVLAVITFHSLEDRRVKLAMRNEVRSGEFEEVLRGGLRPGMAEVRRNPRARSTRLRVLRRKPGTN